MIIYRMTQFFNALWPKIEQREYYWLDTILTPKEIALFKKQSLAEQRHSLDIALELHQQQESIMQKYGKAAYHNLMVAALFHDCGKSLITLHLWQRIFIVASGFLPDQWRTYISQQRNVFGKTLVIYTQHPAWGKQLAAKAGANQEVQTLIQNHHTPNNALEKILSSADNHH